MANSKIPVVQTIDIAKQYAGGIGTWALRGVDFAVAPGEFVSIVGASGSGKSTLLNMIGALDKPTSGAVYIDGQNTSYLDECELAALRGDTLGFIFQFHHLLSEFSLLENALMPANIRKGFTTKCDREWTEWLMCRVGLKDKMHSKPRQLSGGQQQRGAIVRALANRPKVVLADEPTGNLDTRNSGIVMDLLKDLNQQLKIGFVLVTHDSYLAKRAQRIVVVEDGRLVADYDTQKAEKESKAM